MTTCHISITTKQTYDDHTENLKQSFQGKLSRKNDSTFIIYKEECDDLSVTNQIKVCKEGQVSVRRMGGHKSLLQFSKDQPYTTFYNTGHGTLELTFKSITIACNETECGYTVHLQYDIYMDDGKLSSNEYTLEATYGD